MNINMQLLENMTEQERFDWFEDIPEEELLAQLDAMAEPERLALLEKIMEVVLKMAKCGFNTIFPSRYCRREKKRFAG